MSDDLPRSPRRLSAITMPEVPIAKHSSNQMLAVRPFAVKIGDAAPPFDGLAACLGRPLIVLFAPVAAHGALTIALRDACAVLEKKRARALLIVAGSAPQSDVTIPDHDGAIHRKYGVLDPDTGRPRLSAFLINSDGCVAGVFVPGEPERALRLALDALDLAR